MSRSAARVATPVLAVSVAAAAAPQEAAVELAPASSATRAVCWWSRAVVAAVERQMLVLGQAQAVTLALSAAPAAMPSAVPEDLVEVLPVRAAMARQLLRITTAEAQAGA
jgi:hypothetical protein